MTILKTFHTGWLLLVQLFTCLPQLFAQRFDVVNSMSLTRERHTATLLQNENVLIVGGISFDGNTMTWQSSAELYNPATSTWTNTGLMNRSRYYHTATMLSSGKVLVTGGRDISTPDAIFSAELYDSGTGGWTTTGSMFTNRYYHTATLLLNGKVLVAGGYNNSTIGNAVAKAELYDPVTGTWAITGSMSTNRYNHTATLLPNGKVLVTGGLYENGAAASAELYDPVTSKWTITGSMSRFRYNHTATLLQDGCVLVVGGNSGTLISELYNPVTGTWTTKGSISTNRSSHTATLLPNGKVLLAGGNSYDFGTALWAAISSAEVYDPIEEIWTSTATMHANRYEYPATLLPNGKVLIAGGNSSYQTPGHTMLSVLSQVELYQFTRSPYVMKIVSTTNTLGDSVKLNFLAAGESPMVYMFYLNATNIDNGTNSILTISNLQQSHVGNYYVVVTNAYGCVTSSMANIFLVGSPRINVDGQMFYGGSVDKINSTTVTMVSTYTNGVIYYTLDGTVPDFGSALYSGPFQLTNTTVVRAASVDVDTFNMAEAPAVKINITRVVYPMVAGSAGGGSVSMVPAQFEHLSNSIVSVAASASNGWVFLKWAGDASGTNNPLSFTVNAPATNILAVFGTDMKTNVNGNGVVQLNATNPIPYGTTVQATAVPGNGWYFVQWSGALAGTNNPATFTVNSTNPVQALFAQIVFLVVADTSGGGSVNPTQATYPSNSVATITATSSNGWTFLRWVGDTNSSSNPLSFTVNGSKTNIFAIFGTVVKTNIIGAGQVQLNATNPVAYGTMVQATGVASNGSYFVQWGGALAGRTNNPTIFTVTSTNYVQAVFTPPVFASTPGGGSVNTRPENLNYPADSILSITATASNGWSFLKWTGDAIGTNNPLSLTMNSPKIVSAVFGTTLGTAIIGNGSVELTTTNPVAFGTSVQATALVSNGSYFVQWGGALAGTNNPSKFTVISTSLVRAVFSTLPTNAAALTVRITGGGVGNVAVNPQRAYYTLNDSVSIIATPQGATNQFVGWSGDFVGTMNPLVLPMNTSKVVTANFVIGLPALQTKHTTSANAALVMSLTGLPRQSYVLQSTTNLGVMTQWEAMFTNAADTNGGWQFSETNFNRGGKFFRVTTP